MRLRTTKMIIAVILCIYCAGCGKGDKVYFESADTELKAQETELSAVGDVKESDLSGNDEEFDLYSGAAQSKEEGYSEDTLEDVRVSGEENLTQNIRNETEDVCYVYICGAVISPGVYRMQTGSRVYEVIEAAGGLSEEASAAAVNQAESICDGQMIYIPTKEEAEAGVTASIVGGSVSQEYMDDRVNINTASAEELMTLTGIGQTKADSILAYRDVYGGFSSVEEIMSVDGIKEGLYNQIKDDIRVK